MARYEQVLTAFWDEPDFEDWPPHAKLLYLYLITSPLSHGVTGVYKVSSKRIMAHTGMNAEQLAEAFEAIGDRVKRYPGGWVWVVARFKYACTSPNHVRNAIRYMAEEVPDTIAAEFWERYTEHPAVLRCGLKPPEAPQNYTEAPCKPLPSPFVAPPKPLARDIPPILTYPSTSTKLHEEGRMSSGEDATTTPPPKKRLQFSHFVKEWNRIAEIAGLPACKTFREDRKRHLRARMHDPFWMEHWKEALDAIPNKPFLCGENARGWRANVDFFLRPRTVTSIMEGKYDGHATRTGPNAFPGDDHDLEVYRDMERHDRGGAAGKPAEEGGPAAV